MLKKKHGQQPGENENYIRMSAEAPLWDAIFFFLLFPIVRNGRALLL